MAKTVRVVFLGGVGEIGKNMTALEYGDDIIIVDCGVEFPREDSPGIDAIIPDVTYIRENLHKLRGVVLTHGHEDHIGALPYYGEEFDAPIYGTALTLGLLPKRCEYSSYPFRSCSGLLVFALYVERQLSQSAPVQIPLSSLEDPEVS